MTGIEVVMGAAVGLAEAVDLSQDEKLSVRQRAAARREINDYKKKMASMGVEVFFLNEGGVPVDVRAARICWVMLTSKRKLGVGDVAKMVARREPLEGKLSPLRNSILVTPVQDQASESQNWSKRLVDR